MSDRLSSSSYFRRGRFDLGNRCPDVLIYTYGARLLGAEQRHGGLKPNSTLFRLIEDGQELPRERHPLDRAARVGETVSDWRGRLEPELGDSAQVMIIRHSTLH